MAARTTLAGVAARAGVSASTASLAFAGSPRVTAATRDRVLTAAAELGYAGPDPLAASLRRGRSGVIGVFIGERLLYAFRDPVSVQLLDGITEVLGAHGAGLLLLAGDSGRPSIEQILRMPLDAAIFATCGLEDDPALTALLARGVPVVAVEGPDLTGVPLIDIDDRGGITALAEHLWALGHRRAATVAMPLRLDGTRGEVGADRRARGHYRDVRHRIAGVEDVFGPLLVYETASNSVAEGEQAGRVVLDVPAARRPTAVLAQSDVLAAGVLAAAARLGLRVPEDVSVTGFDGADLHWLAPVVLTTVVQPTEEKGRIAASTAMAVVAGEPVPDVLLPVSLRHGTTTGPAPGRPTVLGHRADRGRGPAAGVASCAVTTGIDPSVSPSGSGCVECDAAGGWWVHLRRCAQCGHIGCCDTSPAQHATAHARSTGHAVVQSFEPGEDWFWDYDREEGFTGPALAPPGHRPVDQSTPGPADRVPADWRAHLH